MRVLNKRQKQMLDTWFDNNWEEGDRFKGPEDLGEELLSKLKQISNHETLWQDINRYILDKILDKLYA